MWLGLRFIVFLAFQARVSYWHASRPSRAFFLIWNCPSNSFTNFFYFADVLREALRRSSADLNTVSAPLYFLRLFLCLPRRETSLGRIQFRKIPHWGIIPLLTLRQPSRHRVACLPMGLNVIFRMCLNILPDGFQGNAIFSLPFVMTLRGLPSIPTLRFSS